MMKVKDRKKDTVRCHMQITDQKWDDKREKCLEKSRVDKIHLEIQQRCKKKQLANIQPTLHMQKIIYGSNHPKPMKNLLSR